MVQSQLVSLAPSAQQATLQTRGLVKSFRSGTEKIPVLTGVDLDLEPGQTLVVLGPSGCGKSTLLHLLALLDRPDAGTLKIDGVDYASASEGERRRYRERHVGFVFQAFHLIPEMTVLQNAALPGRLAGLSGARVRARELLDHLGVASLQKRSPATLSGGERQRVAVARALYHSPAWLFADEPTGNLDPKTGKHVMNLIRETCFAVGAHLVLVTHNEGLIAPGDVVIHLENGTIT